MRVPCVVRWPGHDPGRARPATRSASTIDLLPTFARLAGGGRADRPHDRRQGHLAADVGQPGAKSPHEAFSTTHMDQLQAVRSGKWKLHLPLKAKKNELGQARQDAAAELYDLDADIHEDHNVADEHPDVVKRLMALAAKARRTSAIRASKAPTSAPPAGWTTQPADCCRRSRSGVADQGVRGPDLREDLACLTMYVSDTRGVEAARNGQ